jgi:hypothetical protein
LDAPDVPATACTWTEGLDSLLPLSGLVGFVSRSAGPEDLTPVALVEWRHVAEVVGHLMEPIGVYPERFRVAAFPGPEQMLEMRRRGPDLLQKIGDRRRRPSSGGDRR